MSNSQVILCKIIIVLFKVLGLIPRKMAFKAGSLIGQILFSVDRKHRNIALNNLTRAFGHEKSSYEIKILARRVFKNLGQIIFDIGWSLGLESRDFQKHFKIQGLSNYKNAYEKGRGVLFLTAHMGNWELLSIIMAMVGYPISVLYRPLDFFPLDRFFAMIRGRFGAELIPSAQSMRKILRTLKHGKVVGMLMDQNVDWHEGVFIDFFGHRACTNKGLALLARRTEAPVVPVFLVREKSGFMAEFGSEIHLIKTEDIRKDLEANTQQYNRVIEDFIRRYPDQWFWVHQRWKTKPYCPWPRKK
ncbi:MAG: Kdo2-lipid IVA lauroyltransferase [Desulfobacteraceae bacterium Eth-SRB1]|nr:MAG: Kdo2-lipid IVA lauroyltransferase [Desulfobacteraceae bacterium Eth-SRB1]